MSKRQADQLIPTAMSQEALAEAIHKCTRCDLYRFATQAVPGEGPDRARILLLGEQPGDREDVEGRPFVGPAGGVLDRALVDAGLDRKRVYLTNAVKHFSFEERGKRRIHKKPRISEIDACRPWLEAEIAAVRPGAVVCLGTSAARSLFGKAVRLADVRGQVLEHEWAKRVIVTLHPSAVLRVPDHAGREQMYSQLVEDLKAARCLLQPAKPERLRSNELRRG